MKEMFFLFFVLLSFSQQSAAHFCENYLLPISGDYEKIKPVEYTSAVDKLKLSPGIPKDVECNPDELCVLDSLEYTLENNEKAHLVMSSCQKINEIETDRNCYWRFEKTSGNSVKKVRNYRCTCDVSNNRCDTRKHLLRQFAWAFPSMSSCETKYGSDWMTVKRKGHFGKTVCWKLDFHKESKTYDEFKEACKSEGAYVASVRDEEEHTLLKNLIVRKSGEQGVYPHIYIGAKRNAKGVFVWEHDNRTVSYTDWHGFNPNNYQGMENCILLWTQASESHFGKWGDIPCNGSSDYPVHGAPCEKELPLK